MPRALFIFAIVAASCSQASCLQASFRLRTHHTTASRPRAAHLVLNQQQQQDQSSVLVQRGTLPGVHVHLGAMLLSLAVDLFMRFAPQRRPRPISLNPDQPVLRTVTPCFLEGALCERVENADTETEHWVCLQGIEHPDYTARKAARNGQWVWFCSKNR